MRKTWVDQENRKLREKRRKTPGPRPARYREPWTPQEDELLAQLYGTLTARQIAQELQRTYQTVQQRISQRGLPARGTTCVLCDAPIVQAKVGRPRRHCPPGTECARAHTVQLRRVLEPPVPITIHSCVQCGEQFEGRQSTKYCGRTCMKRAWHEKQQAHKIRGLSISDPQLRERCLQLLEQGMSFRAVARETGLAYTSVQSIAQGRTGQVDSPWTPERSEYVLQNAFTTTSKEMAQKLGLRISQVDGRIAYFRQKGLLSRDPR